MAKKKISDTLNQKRVPKKKVLNPFEIHVNKQKFSVLGRKVKSEKGVPGISRARAIKKRKATLLQEYRVKGKSNKFMDMRIGERNSAMTAEDKIVARFAAERMRSHKKNSIFNLADEEILTHHGQTLNEIENFYDPRSDEDDAEDSGKLSAGFVEDVHFGGGVLTKTSSDGALSRKNLIDQLIAVSKKRKVEQQRAREQTLELTEKLDSEWKDLLPIVSASKKRPGDVQESLKPDAYDTVMRQLKMEARGKPSDKLKTEEEIAKEEQERLEKLEAERQRRMQGITDEAAATTSSKHRSADDLDDGFDLQTDIAEPTVMYDDEGKLIGSAKNFAIDDGMEHSGDEGKADNERAESQGKDSDGDGDDSEGESEAEDETESEEENDNMSDLKSDDSDTSDEESADNSEDSKDLESKPVSQEKPPSDMKMEDNLKVGEYSKDSVVEQTTQISQAKPSSDVKKDLLAKNQLMDQSRQELTYTFQKGEYSKDSQVEQTTQISQATPSIDVKRDLLARKKLMDQARQELPYTFEVPDSYEGLQQLLAGRGPEHQAVILERMVKCTHPSLAEGNKDKLSTLFAYLLQHLDDAATSQDGGSACFSVLDRLAPHLYDIAHFDARNAQHCVLEVLKEKQQDFRKHPRTFPGVDTLVVLKVVSLLFPTSDFRHQVVTPALVFMEQMLHTCRVRTEADVAAGLFVCTLMLEFTDLSKRFSPMGIVYLRNVIVLAVPMQDAKMTKKTPGLLVLSDNMSSEESVGEELMQMTDLSDAGPRGSQFKVRALHTSVRLLREFCSQLEALPAAHDVLGQCRTPLAQLPLDQYPPAVHKSVQELHSALDRLADTRLQLLVLERKKPKALRLYEPNIQQVFDMKRQRPMGAARREREKLVHKFKREMKGAMREIRRDRTFLAKLKLKETARSDEERLRKVKEIFGSAAAQQSELKKLKKKK